MFGQSSVLISTARVCVATSVTHSYGKKEIFCNSYIHYTAILKYTFHSSSNPLHIYKVDLAI